MIFFSVGLPGSFAEWCDAILIELVRRMPGSVESVTANSPENLAASVIKARAANIVCSSRYPNNHLRRILADTGSRFLCVIDDPRVALAQSMAAAGKDLPTAIKEVASSCACVMQYSSLSGALRLSADHHAQTPIETIKAIGNHFGMTVADADLPCIIESVRALGLTSEQHPVDAWWDSLGEPGKALIAGTLDAYATYFSTGKLGNLIWRRGLFLLGDTPEPAHGVIELTGRARNLIHGPYILLPPGSCTFHVVFGCSKEAAGVSLLFDVLANSKTQLAPFTRFQPKTGGIFEVILTCTIEESDDQLIEVRIFNERAMFDGRMSLGGVTVIYEHGTQSVRDPALAAELGLDLI